MRIEADSVVPFPRARVFTVYRDELRDFATRLPNVRSLEVRSREESAGVVRLVNVWQGGGDIPAAARGVIGERALGWDDHATWSETEWTCRWDIRPHVFPGALTCRGTTTFVDLGGTRTRLEIRGTLEVDLKKVRGVPAFLAGSVGPAVAQFLVRAITPNLTGVGDVLTRHLEEKA